jgi:hypothetical protein
MLVHFVCAVVDIAKKRCGVGDVLWQFYSAKLQNDQQLLRRNAVNVLAGQ